MASVPLLMPSETRKMTFLAEPFLYDFLAFESGLNPLRPNPIPAVESSPVLMKLRREMTFLSDIIKLKNENDKC